MLCALAGFTTVPTGGILFSTDSHVPLPVQAFAWRVIEAGCSFQRHELGQRSFWAHDARARRVDGTVVYSIDILSELTWQRSDPPVQVAMVVVDDGERLRLADLRSTFITCTAERALRSR